MYASGQQVYGYDTLGLVDGRLEIRNSLQN
jgi:hypothetical protein